MTQNHRQFPTDGETGPGADRFWGEFSRVGTGRRDDGEKPEPEPPEGQAGPEPTGPGQDGPAPLHEHGECLEWCPICRSAELLRSALTPELREQAEALQREALTVFQAFLAAYGERTGWAGDPRPRRPAGDPAPDDEPDPDPAREVTDIPLD